MNIVIYGTQNCHFCYKARELAANNGVEAEYIEAGHDLVEFGNLFPNAKTVPQIIVDGICIGGYDSLKSFFENGEKAV